MKVDEMPLPETEAARKIVEETIESDEKKDEESFDREISEQVSKLSVMFGFSLFGKYLLLWLVSLLVD